MLTSFSVSFSSTLGQPIVADEPNEPMSKLRKAASNMRFISRCSARNGLPVSLPWRVTLRDPSFQGTRSRSAILILLSCFRIVAALRCAACRTVTRRRFSSGRLLLFGFLALVAGADDRDPTRLHRLRHIPHQDDLEQA